MEIGAVWGGARRGCGRTGTAGCLRGGGVLLVLCGILLGSCGDPHGEARRVRLVGSSSPRPPSPPGRGALRFALAAVLSPEKAFPQYDRLARYMGGKLGRSVHIVHRRTYAETNDLLKIGYAQFGIICTGAYVRARRAFGLELLVAPVCDGQSVYHSHVVVRAASPIRNLDDLRGVVFAFSDPLSNSGCLYMRYLLAKRGETPESFFSDYFFTHSHDNSILAVAEGLADGAAVDSLIWDYEKARDPERTAGLRIIDTSPPFGINPVVVTPKLSPTLKAKLRDILLHMHEDEEGHAILESLDIDSFADLSDTAYDSVREMLDAVEKAEREGAR